MSSTSVERRRVTLDLADGDRADGPVDVAYSVAGEGPPVVFCHGIGLDDAGVSWRYALPMLAHSHRVYALDFPGHGDSGKPRVRYTTGYFRRALSAFLDALDLDDAALVGVSMGGAVALGHALDHPVEKLVLVDAYGLGADAGWRPPAWLLLRTPLVHRRWWRWVGTCRASVRTHLAAMCAPPVPGDLVDDVYAAVQDADVGETVASWQRSEFRACGLHTDYRDRLAGLDVPTLFCHGAADPLVPSYWSERAGQLVSNARAEVFRDAGHWLPREQPEAFNRLVRAFLN